VVLVAATCLLMALFADCGSGSPKPKPPEKVVEVDHQHGNIRKDFRKTLLDVEHRVRLAAHNAAIAAKAFSKNRELEDEGQKQKDI